ncbi:type I pantothenate kinase [Aerococcaceae bacterium DSM 111021]|nr:type I pantothenate kinase [Aerococcaceae bacterium DSM 111021]
MSTELFTQYSREEWEHFNRFEGTLKPIVGLEELVSLNDRLSQDDVKEIYVPLVHYIDVMHNNKKNYGEERDKFFNIIGQKSSFETNTFMIGVSGSVAVGKSTSARVLQRLLEKYYPDKRIGLVTTDGFLYPNAELERRGIMKRKGFPESYDMPSLVDFMSKVKVGKDKVEYPTYSHEIYDIVPGEMQVMKEPDILIVEGINAFQLPENQQTYMNEFFDFSIYIDADPLHIKKWFMDRFIMHMESAKDDPTNYFYEISKWPQEKVEDYGNEIWYTINLTNLVQHIQPTRGRADVILHKGINHSIDNVYVRKY